MNEHNEQQWPEYLMLRDTGLYDDAGGLGQQIFTTAGAGYVKQKYIRADLATQPAAAQEAAATVESFTNGSYHRNYKLRWHKNVDAGTQLFAAPVTAAPARVTRDDAEQAIDRIMGEYGFSMPSRAYAELVDEFMCTTAAPGIDLAALRARVVSAIERITSGTGQMRVPADLTDPDLVLADVLTLLDAIDPHCTDSPKGGSDARHAVMAALVEAATAVERADADGELTDDLVDRLRAARDAAQAGDAEVQS